MNVRPKISFKVWIAAAAALAALAVVIGFMAQGRLTAAVINLMKTEGTVDISNDKGALVVPKENLKLYSGYGMETRAVSYAWIRLDDVKLVKMDEASEVEIQKDGKKLELLVNSGGLFFHVKEPLAEDETMTIRMSTMLVGIRGTCGWVVSDGSKGAQVYILEGAVEAEAVDTGETVPVSAGEMAEITVNEAGETEITVLPFAEEHIAPFVLSELEDDGDLSGAVLEASGLDALNPPDPAERLRAEYMEIVNGRAILDKYAEDGTVYTADGLTYASEGLSYAAIVDLDGDGTEELVLITQKHGDIFGGALTKLEVYGDSMGHAALYGENSFPKENFRDDRFETGFYVPNSFYLAEHNGKIYVVAYYGAQFACNYCVFAAENGALKLVEYAEAYNSDSYLPLSIEYSATEANWDLTSAQNICPELPSGIRQKNAFLSVLYPDYSWPVFAKLAGEGEQAELYLLDMFDGGYFGKYTWDGTALQYTELENRVVYAKLLDMNQDGTEELLVVNGEPRNYGGDYDIVVYSWDGVPRRTELSCNSVLEGLYREKATGYIYVGSSGLGSWGVFDTLSGIDDSVILDTEFNGTAYWLGNEGTQLLESGVPGIEEEYRRREAEYERQVEVYSAQLERFEQLESIDLAEDHSQEFARMEYTVDELCQQLLDR